MEQILVGVDGSAESKAALGWAAAEAAAKPACVHALMVVEDPTPDMWIPHSPLDDRLKIARQQLARLVGGARAEHPSVDIEPEVREGRPASLLLEEAKKADLLVVGNRGRGAVAGALLGSVSLHCVAQSPCPVVVVRESHHPASR